MRDCENPGGVDVSSVTPATSAVLDTQDDSPAPRLRGNWRGFLPDATVNELRTSAASGAGLAAMPPAIAPRDRDGLLLGLALLSLYLAFSRSN